VGLSAIRIPLAALVAPGFGLLGVWWILALTAIARAAAMTALWHWGRWEQAHA
jgi:Na+-driven multidrug efflux pump